MSAKLKSALVNMAAAEKALKTSMFKWSPDYDTAASEFTKAATNFKLAGSPEKSKDAYIKASQIQEKMGSLFHAAKLLTQAAGISSDLKNLEEAVSLMERACSLYREHGAPDTAALTLSKAGKMCEANLPSKSTDLYLQASDLCEGDEKLRDAGDYLNNAVRMELKQKRFLKAADILKKRLAIMKSLGNVNISYHIILSMIIAYLAEGDYVSAEKAYKDGFEVDRYGESDEAMYGEQFLKSFEDGDAELLNKTKSAPMITHMDTEFARLAKTLKITDVGVVPSNGKSELEQFEDDFEQKQGGGNTDDVTKEEEDNDDFEGGLC